MKHRWPASESYGELDALLALLDDTDPYVTTAVQQRLIAYGHLAVPSLRRAMATNPPNSALALNAHACIRAIQTAALAEVVDMVIAAQASSADIQLEDALMALSRFGHPETDTFYWRRYLDDLASQVYRRERHLPTLSETARLVALNTVLFENEQLRGAVSNYHLPRNTYLATVLESKEGIPISLSCVYMLVARRAGIEVWGIGMPLHFVVYHPSLDVFIDPFNAGTFISHDDCRRFIQNAGFTFNDAMLQQRSNIEIVQRTMRNLIYAHTRSGQEWEAETLRDTLETIIRLTA
jgi:regulator of sirC expression with transglutaminase-like and TPR domain